MVVTPLQAAENVLSRAEALLDEGQNHAGTLRDDLARVARAMGTAALDTYLHWAIRVRLTSHDDGLPRELRKLEMPLENLTRVADTTLENRREGIDGRPWVQVKGMVGKQLTKETFQSSNDVLTGYRMAGGKDLWGKVSDTLDQSKSDLISRLDRIVFQRNRVVHEGDLRRLQRPQNIRYNSVDPAAVTEDLAWLRKLIGAIDDALQ